MRLLVLQTKVPLKPWKRTNRRFEELTVDELRRVMHNRLDQSFLLEVTDSHTGQATTNFKTFDEDALTDEFESGDFFNDTVVGSLVKGDRVLSLVFNLSLRPLLLLCSFST
jgi:hypothetical protein